jgi:hypothetical protein
VTGRAAPSGRPRPVLLPAILSEATAWHKLSSDDYR